MKNQKEEHSVIGVNEFDMENIGYKRQPDKDFDTNLQGTSVVFTGNKGAILEKIAYFDRSRKHSGVT